MLREGRVKGAKSRRNARQTADAQNFEAVKMDYCRKHNMTSPNAVQDFARSCNLAQAAKIIRLRPRDLDNGPARF
jgi:hypothetical protein